jgi:cytochrome c oxidase assembly protein subunit 15
MSLRYGLSPSLQALLRGPRLLPPACQPRRFSLFTRSTRQPRDFPHFTPSYPNFFSPSRYISQSKPVFTSGNGSAKTAQGPLPSKGVYRWLFLCSGLTLGVTIVGGVTRLTESGLSITEWRPVTGILPPLGEQTWEEEFSKYRATPEFKM